MKQLLLFLILIPSLCFAQYDSTKNRQTINAYGYEYKNIKVGSSLIIPNDTPHLAQKDSNAIGAINGRVYSWTGQKWNSFEVTLTSDPNKVDSVTYYNDSLWEWKADSKNLIGVISASIPADTSLSIGNRFDQKVNVTRTLTINGTTYDLSANRTWTVGDLLSSGSYSNPSWITDLSWSKITGAPSFLTYHLINGFTNLAGSGVPMVKDTSGNKINHKRLKGGYRISVTDMTDSVQVSLDSTTQTLTDGATITFDASLGVSAKVTLGGNRTLAFTNFSAGTYLTLVVIQDGTGSRTLTLPTCKVINGGSGAVTLTTAANSEDILTFFKIGTTIYCNYGKNYN